eukprot:9493498-Pyramimonas_sp.AAC.2
MALSRLAIGPPRWARPGLTLGSNVANRVARQLEPSDPWWAALGEARWPAASVTRQTIAAEVAKGGADGDRRCAPPRAIAWRLRAIGWTLRARMWTLRAIWWTLRAIGWTSRA